MYTKKNLFSSVVFTCCLLLAATSGLAQNDSADDQAAERKALADAEARLVEVLNSTDDLFYKATKRDDAPSLYTVRWEQDGTVSNITLMLRPLGTYKGEHLFGMLAYVVVAESEKTFPPAVIKLITVKSDACVMGGFSMPDTFSTVYLASTIPSDTLKPGQLWLTCAYLHMHGWETKKEIDKIMADFGK